MPVVSGVDQTDRGRRVRLNDAGPTHHMTVASVPWSDSRLGLYRSLSDGELLRRHGLFIAEGRLVVERVIESGRYELVSALLNDASLAALLPLFEARAPGVPLFQMDAQGFEQVTGFNIHRGCLALVRRPAPLDWRQAVGRSRVIVVLEAVSNADNVGGVFRTAAAFGAGAVLLSPTSCDPLYRKAVRTSMGAVLNVPFARLNPWPGGLEELSGLGFRVAALTPSGPSVTLAEFAGSRYGDPVALVVGSEGRGLTPEARAGAATAVRIPMADGVDSLNLVVATGIALARLNEWG
jgi:tRNA G18 (ribose-2'-O)-methylase SpoU